MPTGEHLANVTFLHVRSVGMVSAGVVVVAGVTDRDIALGMELGRHTFVYVTANITPSGR